MKNDFKTLYDEFLMHKMDWKKKQQSHADAKQKLQTDYEAELKKMTAEYT